MTVKLTLLTILEIASIRSGCHQGSVLASIFLACSWASPHRVLTWWRARARRTNRDRVRDLWGLLFVRAHTIGSGPYIYDLIYFNLNYPLRGASPNAVTLGIRASKYEFGEGGHNHSVRNTYKIDIYFHVCMIAFVYLLPFIVFTVLFSLYFLKLYLMIPR